MELQILQLIELILQRMTNFGFTEVEKLKQNNSYTTKQNPIYIYIYLFTYLLIFQMEFALGF